MEESGGNEGLKEGLEEEEISLLANEIIHLSMKSAAITPDDLESILEGQPWMFRKQLVIFDRLIRTTERSRIKFVSSLFWLKIGSCPPEFDKKDLMHAIGVTFGGIVISEINGEYCRIKVKLNVQKPLRRGIFVSIEEEERLTIQEEGRNAVVEDHERIDGKEGSINSDRKASWRRMNFARERGLYNDERIERKRKLSEFGVGDYAEDSWSADIAKRMKYETQDLQNKEELILPTRNWGNGDSPKQRRSAAAKGQADRAVRRLRLSLKQNNPDMVFFMETKIDTKRMEGIRRRCGFMNGIDVGAEGSRGGLCLAWKEEYIVSLKTFSKNHIDVPIEKSIVNGKIGGIPREERKMAAFREVLDECLLMDIGFQGAWFTWESGNLPNTNIRERLDRGVANENWMHLFPKGTVQHLTHSISDHCSLLLQTDKSEKFNERPRFKFEAWWTLEESFEQEVRSHGNHRVGRFMKS
ncbi:reverse transcriptase [Gossypium australe]|uniref:Reverse transcriptase n=1 Tax=Gossypium australe TaxID=47621 RepID=A0A5B6WPG2_9ROSI|nr:reverse transcriptase [Gossypium australe]